MLSSSKEAFFICAIFKLMKRQILLLNLSLILWACTTTNSPLEPREQNFKILSLGDRYTAGTGVCSTCSFPEQLRDSLSVNLENSTIELTVIAQSSWTSSDLINGIQNADLPNDFDLVTLLIGVNNQFQGVSFNVFMEDFDNLVARAIELANNNRGNILVISIFDYANTEFGQIFGGPMITEEITWYNTYIASYCQSNDLRYIDKQNLIFNGLVLPELIAEDGLHPSTLAYSNLVTTLLPVATTVLID
jgi:acyl-CoA thioesterase-1